MPTPFKSLEDKLDYLLDREAIRDVLSAYAVAMDQRDWDSYRACFTDEIVMDFSEATGVPTPPIKIDDWLKIIQAFFEPLKASQHLKLPVKFDIRGDDATILSLMQGKHFMPNFSGDALHTVVGYYRDTLVRTADGWRIREMKELVHWNEGNGQIFHDITAKATSVFQALVGGHD